jgi:hypothetical protein
MPTTATSPSAWWEARRLRYNVGLINAGILAFIACMVVGSALLPPEADFEVTPFTVLGQGVGYLLMIAVANVGYFLGPLSERLTRPADPERYLRICYRLGFWFSVLLPFSMGGSSADSLDSRLEQRPARVSVARCVIFTHYAWFSRGSNPCPKGKLHLFQAFLE